ncbi:MAG: Dipeptide transport system permease protein DppB [Anaerolineales bacterium]|nr:Dipeptide transport system permease protein DppB [Anaerolineales bacterium]
MTRYILGRLASLVFVFFAVSIITFLIMHSVPGGPFDETKMPLPPEAKANILRKYGLDRPLWEQYARYMWHAFHLDFGVPFQSPTESVTELIRRVWPPTIQLGILAVLFAYVFGLLFGILAAIRQNSWLDYVVTLFATSGIAVPNFVIATWLVLVFAVRLRWLPTGGWDEPKHAIMPVIAYAVGPMALVARYTRVSMLEVLSADYVRTARAKGLTERRVVLRHVLKNALIPLITVLGPYIPNLLTGSIFIESVFRVPGLGRFFVTSMWERDYPLIMALMLLIAVLWGGIYLISDILYTVVDPRVRLDSRSA